MKTFTISEAKAKLSALVESAENGEQVLIMRGSKPAVTLVPIHEEDLMIWPELNISDRAATALLKEAKEELATGKAKVFETADSIRKLVSSRHRVS